MVSKRMQRSIVAATVAVLTACASVPDGMAPRLLRLDSKVLAGVCSEAALHAGPHSMSLYGGVEVKYRYDGAVVEYIDCTVSGDGLDTRVVTVDICSQRDSVRRAREMLVNAGQRLPVGCEWGIAFAKEQEWVGLWADWQTLCSGPEPHAILAQCYALSEQIQFDARQREQRRQ
jgi:hypothetical protein